jgi:hypothetical protein
LLTKKSSAILQLRIKKVQLKLSNQELCSSVRLVFIFRAGRLNFTFALTTIDEFAFAVTFTNDSVFGDAF